MKKHIFLPALAVISALAVSLGASAAFAKTASYEAGRFIDVPEEEWFASSVKDAYEFGLMKGDSDTSFSPNGTLTVAEGITIVTRMNETLTGHPNALADTPVWYEKYVNYAVSEGIMASDRFDDFERNITRAEIAELFAAVCSDLPAVNAVKTLPDVPAGAEYTAAVQKLYNAGILTGNDEFGTFAPDSSLLRSEISAMAVRIADPSKRVTKQFAPVEGRTFDNAYDIIEYVVSQNTTSLPNGWLRDNRFELFNTSDASKNHIADGGDEAFTSLIREFAPENSGTFALDAILTLGSKNGGTYIAFENADGEKLFGLKEIGGKWALFGTEQCVSDVDFGVNTKQYAVSLRFDLDLNTLSASVDNQPLGTVSIPMDVTTDRLVLGTEKKGSGSVKLHTVYFGKNRVVRDRFLVTSANRGETPSDYTVTGDFKIAGMASELGDDVNSVCAETKKGSTSTAVRKFEKVRGNVDIETFILLPEAASGASFAVYSGENAVFAFTTDGSDLLLNGEKVHTYTPNVWQNLHLEADTASGSAIVKINGKTVKTVTFEAPYFDSAAYTFTPDKDAVMWFDDLSVSCLNEYADYPSAPVSAQNDAYNVGVNVCNLWRDAQSGEGWDAASAFSEFDPYLGYYDEGLREVADWEIKLMAEHGIDFINTCWYCPNPEQNAPIKRERIAYSALHDGYMNAKYSGSLGFSIMWENGYRGASTPEQFWNYIFPYWKEYYFSDDRYVRLDNKALLTVWTYQTFSDTFGGTEGTKEAIARMNEELKELGYDGILIFFAAQSSTATGTFNNLTSVGAAGTYAYHWSTAGHSAAYQNEANESSFANAMKSNGGVFLPTVSIGFNNVARAGTRQPIITFDDHLKVCENIRDLLAVSKTGTYADNTLIVSTWNEYTEGTYVAPCTSIGFNYLENIKTVFGTDTGDHTTLDAPLTSHQLSRLDRLYPPHFSRITRLHLEQTEDEIARSTIDIDSLEPRYTYDMTTNEGLAGFRVMFGIDGYSEGNGVIKGHGTSGDFAIFSEEFRAFKAAGAPFVHIRMKTSETGKGEIFFITTGESNWTDAKHTQFEVKTANEFCDYYINLGNNSKWTDDVIGFRIDPLTAVCDFEISLVEFMSYPEVAAEDIPGVIVNGKEMSFTFAPAATADGDLRVTVNNGSGFFSQMGLFTRFDREHLLVKNRVDHCFLFTANSDKVLVDGKEQSCGFTFTLRDGLPTFELGKLCKLLGTSYSFEGKTCRITSVSASELELIAAHGADDWSFDTYGDADEWTAQNSTLYVSDDGCLTLEPFAGDIAAIRNVSFKAAAYNTAVIGVKYYKGLEKELPQFFFATSDIPWYTAEKCVNGKYVCDGKKEGDTVEVVFDLPSCANYAGTIVGIRFDPHSTQNIVKFDYIRFENREKDDSITDIVYCDDANQFEFKSGTEAAAWQPQNASELSVKDGCLTGTSINEDPSVITRATFAADDYQYLIAGVRYCEALADAQADVFFMTSKAYNFEGERGYHAKYKIPKNVKEGDTVEVIFDLTSNKYWTGTITGLRFDMFASAKTDFAIDYIRLAKRDGYVPPLPKEPDKQVAPSKPTEAVLTAGGEVPDGIVVRTEGGAAELATAMNPDDGTTVYAVNCKIDAYVYFDVFMHFEPGKTYTISYTLLPLTDHDGNDIVNDIIGGNLRYKTTDDDFKDHTFDGDPNKSTSHGWYTVEKTVTIPENYTATDNDCFQIWGRPVGNSVGVSYLVGDVSITHD